MKNLLVFLLVFLIGSNCRAKEIEKLPEIPWKAIVDMKRSNSFPGWKSDIRIKLYGNYSSADSVMVDNSISELNRLTETIQLGFAKKRTVVIWRFTF